MPLQVERGLYSLPGFYAPVGYLQFRPSSVNQVPNDWEGKHAERHRNCPDGLEQRRCWHAANRLMITDANCHGSGCKRAHDGNNDELRVASVLLVKLVKQCKRLQRYQEHQ